MNEPQFLKDHQISEQTQITNEPKISKQPQISKVTQIMNKCQILKQDQISNETFKLQMIPKILKNNKFPKAPK